MANFRGYNHTPQPPLDLPVQGDPHQAQGFHYYEVSPPTSPVSYLSSGPALGETASAYGSSYEYACAPLDVHPYRLTRV